MYHRCNYNVKKESPSGDPTLDAKVVELMVTIEEIRRENLIDSPDEAGFIRRDDLTGENVSCGIGL